VNEVEKYPITAVWMSWTGKEAKEANSLFVGGNRWMGEGVRRYSVQYVELGNTRAS